MTGSGAERKLACAIGTAQEYSGYRSLLRSNARASNSWWSGLISWKAVSENAQRTFAT